MAFSTLKLNEQNRKDASHHLSEDGFVLFLLWEVGTSGARKVFSSDSKAFVETATGQIDAKS